MGIIVDNFAGGGGASTGIEMATGRGVDIAINHDPEAIRLHMTNHPHTDHYCESVWDVDPINVCRGREVDLAWFSPDCKHFSKAKGGKPLDKKIRGLCWVALRWMALTRPKVVMLENVEEFQDYGPLNRRGKPIKNKKGKNFRQFVKQIKELGYQVEWQTLVAADYGAPTIRKRFFLIARCDGKPIAWPEPTHAPRDSHEVKKRILQPYEPAYKYIDFSRPCPSIFDTKEDIKEKYGITANRPLKEKTMRRIALGIKKFVIENEEPFLIQVNHTGAGWHYCRSLDEPFPVITSKNGFGIVAPTLIQYHSETTKNGSRGQTLDEPILTIDGSNRYGLVTSFLSKFYKTGIGQDLREPLHTITTSPGHFGEVRAFLIKYYGTGIGQDLKEPLDTITSKDRFGLVTIRGVQYQIVDIGLRMLDPDELYRCNGFPKHYIIKQDFSGKEYPKSEQTKKCGNAVPPPFAMALVQTNLPELCGWTPLKQCV